MQTNTNPQRYATIGDDGTRPDDTTDTYTRDVAEHVARQLPPIALALALAAPTREERARWLAELGNPLRTEELREAHAALEDPEIARDARAFTEVMYPAPRPAVPCALCERHGLVRTHDAALCPVLVHAIQVTTPIVTPEDPQP